MGRSFGQTVQSVRESKGLSIADAARKAGWPWPRWKRIEEDEPKRQDGSYPQLRRDTVLKIAQALSWNEQEALSAAGYIPEKENSPGRDTKNTSASTIQESPTDYTYELTDQEHDELVSSVEGVPPALRPSVIATIKALTRAVSEGVQPTTIGRGKGARNVVDPATGEQIESIEE